MNHTKEPDYTREPNYAELIELGVKQGKGEFPMRPETRRALAVEVERLQHEHRQDRETIAQLQEWLAAASKERDALRVTVAAIAEAWRECNEIRLADLIDTARKQGLRVLIDTLRLAAETEAPKTADAAREPDESSYAAARVHELHFKQQLGLHDDVFDPNAPELEDGDPFDEGYELPPDAAHEQKLE